MKIHQELKEGHTVTRRQLAEMLEVTTKTIQRDINYLRDAYNLPVVYDPDCRSYTYSSSVTDFPGFWVSEKELFALCLAHQALLQYQGTPIHAPLKSAFSKLAESLRGYLTFNIRNLDECVSFSQVGFGSVDDAVFHQISQALIEREVLRFQYLKLDATVGQHLV